MQHRLRTAEGATAYARRSCTIEPTFGDIKTNRAMPGFRRRSLPAAKSEWSFINLAGNMLKLRRHLAATATAGPPTQTSTRQPSASNGQRSPTRKRPPAATPSASAA